MKEKKAIQTISQFTPPSCADFSNWNTCKKKNKKKTERHFQDMAMLYRLKLHLAEIRSQCERVFDLVLHGFTLGINVFYPDKVSRYRSLPHTWCKQDIKQLIIHVVFKIVNVFFKYSFDADMMATSYSLSVYLQSIYYGLSASCLHWHVQSCDMHFLVCW